MNRSPNRLLTFLVIAFVATASLTALLAYDTVRDLVATWNGTAPGDEFIPVDNGDPGALPTVASSTVFDPSAPIQPAGYPAPHAWDGESRVTVLVMGVDLRDLETNEGPPRTDTMMLLTIDPATGTAGMLSIPRDMWVAIPGYDYGKINTAYQLGEIFDLPGGGPGLAMASVEQLLGIEIDYYAQVDFHAFEKLIDEIGGVKLNIPEEIKVDPRGGKPIRKLQPGIQTLPGDIALAYARSRNTPGGDFDRADRQQQVILAIRDRILTFDLLPTLIARAPAIYQDIADGIRTNLTLDQMIRIGLLAGQIAPENIHRAVIGADAVIFDMSPEGQEILKPIPDQIRLVRDEIFASTSSGSPVVVNKSLEELIAEEAAKLSVLNGTTVPGLAATTSGMLTDEGFLVTLTDNADQLYAMTTIIDYSGKPYTLQFLIELLNINPSHIFHSYDPDSKVDIQIILGDDWAAQGATE